LINEFNKYWRDFQEKWSPDFWNQYEYIRICKDPELDKKNLLATHEQKHFTNTSFNHSELLKNSFNTQNFSKKGCNNNSFNLSDLKLNNKEESKLILNL